MIFRFGVSIVRPAGCGSSILGETTKNSLVLPDIESTPQGHRPKIKNRRSPSCESVDSLRRVCVDLPVFLKPVVKRLTVSDARTVRASFSCETSVSELSVRRFGLGLPALGLAG